MSEKYQKNYDRMREAIKRCVKEVKEAHLFTQKRIATVLNKQEYEISNVLNGKKHDPELLMDIGDIVSQYRGLPWSFQQIYKDSFESKMKGKNENKTITVHNSRDKIKFVIETSLLVDASLPEPAIFEGWDEAFKFCTLHNRQELLTMDRPLVDKNGNIIDYGEATILFVYEMLTSKVYTIYNYGKYKISPAFFLGFGMLPINPSEFWQCSNLEKMKEKLNSINDEYSKFLLKYKKMIDEKPTYLIVADDGFDNHMVLNLSDNLNSYISRYKTYRQSFFLDYEEIDANKVNILSLPKMLSRRLNLYVDEYRLSHRCVWNREFEERDLHELIVLDTNSYFQLSKNSPAQRIYEKAVQLLNDSFVNDIGHVDELVKLEKLISLLEFTFLPYACREEHLIEIYHLLSEFDENIDIPEPTPINDDGISTLYSDDEEMREFINLLEKVVKEQETI